MRYIISYSSVAFMCDNDGDADDDADDDNMAVSDKSVIILCLMLCIVGILESFLVQHSSAAVGGANVMD